MTVFEIVVYHLDTIIGTVYLGAQEIFLLVMVALGTVPIKEFMIFNRQQKQVKDFNVRIDNTMIERVESFNYLSIMLNETLSWKSHIEMVGKIFKSYRGTISAWKIHCTIYCYKLELFCRKKHYVL